MASFLMNFISKLDFLADMKFLDLQMTNGIAEII